MSSTSLKNSPRSIPSICWATSTRCRISFANAWDHAQQQDLPADYKDVRLIVLTGMGGSAIGGDYLAALVEDLAPVPVLVNRGYSLPAYVQGPEVLVIASSNSGNTEETLAAFDQAQARGVKLMAVSTGGALSEKAQAAGVPCGPSTTRANRARPSAGASACWSGWPTAWDSPGI